MDQLRDWYIKYREREGQFPDFPPEEEEEPTAEEAAAAAAAAGGKDGGKKDGGKDKGKKGKGAEEEADAAPPPAYFVDALWDSFHEWSDKWQHRDEESNFAQKHDVSLVKQMVRPDVELKVRDEVNVAIDRELTNLRDAYERDQKAKKAKGAKKGKGKKGKKGKGKKGKGGKKGKKLPKDPTSNQTIEFLYRQLVADGIVTPVQKTRMRDFEGSYLFLGAALDKLAEVDETRLPDPSLAQVRGAVTEFCVLPIGSQAVKDHAPLNMSTVGSKDGSPKPKPATPVLLVGAPGTGKKMLVHAVAHETGANLFNLTPSNTDGKYSGKKAYDMVHTTLKVAKALAPSVVWIDDAETVWRSGKVKGATGEPPNRILKHLTAVLNPKKGSGLIEPEDRVLIIGTSGAPYHVEKPKDHSAFTDFFAKILYVPLPNYPSRSMLWTSMLVKHGIEFPDADEVQTLSRISELYSSGSIVNVVRRTLTARRLERLARKPFSINELIGPLAKEEPVYRNVDDEMRKWYHKTLNIGGGKDDEGGGGGGKKKDKKGGKKKK